MCNSLSNIPFAGPTIRSVCLVFSCVLECRGLAKIQLNVRMQMVNIFAFFFFFKHFFFTKKNTFSSKRNRTQVWIQASREQINSSDSLKLLGFWYGEKPGVGVQVENLINRATKRMFVHRYYSKFMPGNDF